MISILHNFMVGFLIVVGLGKHLVQSWPDGAPCLSATVKDMKPAGPAHAFGGKKGPAPFYIRVETTCYLPHTPVRVQLEAKPGAVFTGFSLQARIKGFRKTFGKIQRDDNGSWKYQCFQSIGAITHSHPEQKVRVPFVWMENRGQRQDVEFIASVVVNKKEFWVQNVRADLPYCRPGQYPESRTHEFIFRENTPEFDDPVDDYYCRQRWDEGHVCGKGWTRVFTFEQGFCTPRFWGGCGGTANKFKTLQACEKLCYPRGTIAFG